MAFGAKDGPPSATHLIAKNHDGERVREYERVDGVCYFCGHEGEGMPAERVISDEYFTDHNLRSAPESDVICAYCSYCMDHRELKQGHWIASHDDYRRISTGDLLDEFQKLRDGEYTIPVAVHVSENPIRSEHAYLWTPVVHSLAPTLATYDRDTVRIDWDRFQRLITAIEELRWHGFRGDDIRSGEPRVQDVASVGKYRYRDLDNWIDPFRGSPSFELAWTLSRSKDDQPNPPQSATA